MTGADRFSIADYIDHIRRSVDDLHLCVHGLDEVGFLADRRAQLATVKTIETIGEAMRCLTRDHPDFDLPGSPIPWRLWIATRNRLAHGYADIDLAIVWAVVVKNIPDLEQALARIGDP